MLNGWRNCTLGEFVTLQRGHDLPEPERRPGRVPILGSFGVTGFHDKPKAPGPGVTVGRSGASYGVVTYSESPYWPLNTALYVIDFHGNDERFTYYLLKSLDFSAFNTGSAQPSLNRNHIHPMIVCVPGLAEQRAIVAVLGAVDDKIEQNRRTAQSLERLARAIFRAWFVDFEPVKAKAAGATSFPSMPQPVFEAVPNCFVDSEIGSVPKGWAVNPLVACAQLTMGQSPPSAFYNTNGDGLPFHQGVTYYGFRFPNHRIHCTVDDRVAEPRDVLLSVRAPVGRINVADRRLVLGRGLAGLRHLEGHQSFLLHQLGHVFAEEDAVGEGTIYKAVTKSFLSQMQLLSPPGKAQAAFENVARPLDDLVASHEVESRKLAEMRDYLLPKLLSGNVRVEVPNG